MVKQALEKHLQWKVSEEFVEGMPGGGGTVQVEGGCTPHKPCPFPSVFQRLLLCFHENA